MDKELDPDYWILRKFLNCHYAIPRIYEALERLMQRTEPKSARNDFNPLRKEIVSQMAKTMTDRQIADAHGIGDVSIVERFRGRNHIRMIKKPALEPIKICFRMPAHIIAPASGETTTAHG